MLLFKSFVAISLPVFPLLCSAGSGITDFFAPLPTGFSGSSFVFLKNQLAIIPGDWQRGSLTSYLYDRSPTDPSVKTAFEKIRASSFIAWDSSFFDIIGRRAKVEVIEAFHSPEDQHVHEAPVYLPETNELLYSDTTDIGQIRAIDLDTHKVRKIATNPPLYNVNGGILHNGKVYVLTNGGTVRGLYHLNVTTGEAECLLNNFRGRHLNSPNDLVVDNEGNILFTDPVYGWVQKWPGVGEPELPNAVYHFNVKTKALTPLSNVAIQMPNGLAFSVDGSTLFVADSNSSLQSPTSVRNVMAFDYSPSTLRNPRLVYQAEAGWPDGIRVSQNGFLFIAVANGIDVVDPNTGLLLGKINTPDDIIYNLEPVSARPGVWLLTGGKKIYKVTLAEPGKAGFGRVGWTTAFAQCVDMLRKYANAAQAQMTALYTSLKF